MTARHPADVHAIPWEAGPNGHRADRNCPCSPRAMRDLNVPARVVWSHRRPIERKPVLESEE
jgi:hypothetical protein